MFVGPQVRTAADSTASASVVGASSTNKSATAFKQAAVDCLPMRETVQDVRLTVARIEERSRQLLGVADDHRVRRSVEGLAQGGAAEAAAAARLVAGSSDVTTSNANAEVFLSKLGYSVSEQMRLLRHIEATRPLPAAGTHSVRSIADASGAPNAGSPTGSDSLHASHQQMSVAAFLAAKRSRFLTSLVADAQASIQDREREIADQACAAVWESRKSELADLLGMRSLLETTGIDRTSTSAVGQASRVLSASSVPGRFQTSRLDTTISSAPPPNSAGARRFAKFAHIVFASQPSEWLQRFANAAIDIANDSASNSSANGLANVWTSLHRVLTWTKPIALKEEQQSCDANILASVAASRADLEARAMRGLFSAVHGERAAFPDDFRRMHADKFNELVERFIESDGDRSATPWWIRAFHAARCGRYDAAAVIAADASVSALLKFIGDTHPSKRQTTPFPTSMQEHVHHVTTMYLEDQTTKSPFRAAVLLLLLAGEVGSDDTSSAAVQAAVVRTAASLDDVLWYRLCMVRQLRRSPQNVSFGGRPTGGGGGAANGGRPQSNLNVQTLEEVQRQLLTDQQQLLVTVQGSVDTLVDLLTHALLFNSAARLLLQTPEMHCDGVHVAIVLYRYGLLQYAAGGVETPIDLGATLQRHASVLMKIETVDDVADNTASAVFKYFDITGNTTAFVHLCSSNPSIAVALFGRSAASNAVGGVLLARTTAPPSKAVLTAALDVAEALAANGTTAVAVDVLIAVARGAARLNISTMVTDARRQALLILNPALAHRIIKALAGVSSGLAELYPCCETLLAEVQTQITELPASEVDVFTNLRALADAASRYLQGDTDGLLNTFFALAFVPTSIDSVDTKAHSFNASATEDVINVVGKLLPVVVTALLEIALQAEPSYAFQMRDMATALARWHQQWRRTGPSDVASTLHGLLEKFPVY